MGISVSALLAGCGWFDNSVAVDMGKPRVGAEANVQPTSAMPPPPSGQRFDPPIMPIDETASAPKIGSIVPDSGGQKAQIEKQDKLDAARDEQERAAQIKADQQEKIDNARDAAVGTQANKSAPGTPDVTNLPATQPTASPPMPVTSTPIEPPSNDQKPSGS